MPTRIDRYSIGTIATPGQLLWKDRFTGPQSKGFAIASGPGDTIIVGATFNFSVTVGSNNFTGNGESDLVFAKYDSGGQVIWAKHFGKTGFDGVKQIAMMSDGGFMAIGTFTGAIDFGNSTGEKTSAGGFDIYVARFNSDGICQWSRQYGNSQSETAAGIAVALTDSDNIYITGVISGSVTFGSTTLDSAMGGECFIVKINSSGTVQWAKNFGGQFNSSNARGVAVDSAGKPFVLADFVGSFSIGGSTFTRAGGYDMAIASFASADGTVGIKRQYGKIDSNTTGSISARGIAIDSSGNIFATGAFNGSTNLGSLPSLTSYGGSDIFISKYNSAGDGAWSSGFGNNIADIGTGIAVNSSSVVVTGSNQGPYIFKNDYQGSWAGRAMWLGKLSNAQEHLWATSIGAGTGTAVVEGVAVCFDGTGNVIMTGAFSETIDLGNGPITAPSSGNLFIAKYRG